MKIGRNDPCPCGSGKKYKNCCLENYLESYNYSNDTEIEYEQYSGFRSKSFIRAIKEVVIEEESVCLVTLVRNVEDAIEILKKYVIITDVGEWVVSTGSCDKIKLYGSADLTEYHDIIVEFDCQKLTPQNFQTLVNLSDILKESGEVGEMELEIFKFYITSLDSYDGELVINKRLNGEVK